MNKIKLYGPRRSGTNYLRSLLHRNIDVPILPGTAPSWVSVCANYVFNITGWKAHSTFKDWYFNYTPGKNLGWKHQLVDPERIPDRAAVSVLFITVVKNPYAWLLSVYRSGHRPEMADTSIGQFAGSAFPTKGRENHSSTDFETPIDLWNRKASSYIKLARQKDAVENLRYEDILTDPAAVIEQIARKYQLPLKTVPPKNVDQPTSKSGRTFADYQRYYLEKKWKVKLRPSHVTKINAQLDQDVVDGYGYAILKPREVSS